MILEIIWSLLSLGGLVRALMLWREAILDRRALPTAANGRRLLANWQVEHAWMGVLVYICLLGAGASALLYRLDVLPLSLRLVAASGFLVLTLLILVIRQERDAHYRRRTVVREIKEKIALFEDTKLLVKEIQQRGQSKEQADRTESQ